MKYVRNSWLLQFIKKTMGNNKDNVSNTMLKLESQKITAVQFAQSAKKKKKSPS